MKVYVVLAGMDYEGYQILAIMHDPEKAKDYVTDNADKEFYDNWKVIEWEVT